MNECCDIESLLIYMYSETCLERPPLERPPCLERPFPSLWKCLSTIGLHANWTSLERPPVCQDHFFLTFRVVVPDRFHCSSLIKALSVAWSVKCRRNRHYSPAMDCHFSPFMCKPTRIQSWRITFTDWDKMWLDSLTQGKLSGRKSWHIMNFNIWICAPRLRV